MCDYFYVILNMLQVIFSRRRKEGERGAAREHRTQPVISCKADARLCRTLILMLNIDQFTLCIWSRDRLEPSYSSITNCEVCGLRTQFIRINLLNQHD